VGAGQTLVDIGCGRGELLVAAVAAGADRAIGVEYASAAMELANNTIHRHGLADRCRLVHADARQLPLPDNSAEHVTMLDVVEHLTVEELRLALAEARRILVPGGQLFIHTMPNRLIFSVTYRLQRLVVPWRLAKWPADPRMGHERIMHVNEQTVRTLRRAVRGAGFNSVRVWLGAWVRDDFQPAPRFARLYRGLARVPGLAQFGIADLFATARCP
jgi:ubiquinone/menaquinone biosynthesis C-methylase UbiE